MKGADAEDRAAAHLVSLGRTVLVRNYRVKGGEIDVVSRDAAGVLYFTEVRQRSGSAFGSALESVTPRKLSLMQRAALNYLVREVGREDVPCRLEVLSIDGSVQDGRLELHAVEV